MSRKYWEQRSAWDMYQFMEDAEETADLIARVYRKASLQLEYAARDIFEKFMTKYGLSETDFEWCGKRCSQRIKNKRGDFYGNYIQSK